MRISFFTCLVLMILSINIDAQNSEIQARAKYQKAIEEYGSGNYSDCITSAKSCIQLLGESKPRIEKLLAKSYFSIEDFDQSRKHIKNYFKIAAENDDDYDEMISLLANIEQFEKQKAKEQREKEAAKRKAEEQSREDANYWNTTINANSKKSYQSYLWRYPNGKKSETAKKIIYNIESIEELKRRKRGERGETIGTVALLAVGLGLLIGKNYVDDPTINGLAMQVPGYILSVGGGIGLVKSRIKVSKINKDIRKHKRSNKNLLSARINISNDYISYGITWTF